MRHGITLIELLFVMAIIGILAAVSMGFYTGTASQAKVHRTEAVITKLDQLLTDKWEAYKTRAVPIRLPAGVNPVVAARIRLTAIRELQKFEMPDRITDVTDAPIILGTISGQNIVQAVPSLTKNYRRRASAGWTTQHEGAECLYLIVAAMRDGEDSPLSFFAPSEIGDADGDGMNELHDAFGQPIEFLRWAPGYRQEDGPVTPITKDSSKAPDEFDPLHSDTRWSDSDQAFAPYTLKPLIFSPGPDKAYSINVDPTPGGNPLRYSTTNPPCDPYVGWDGSSVMVGAPTGSEYADNLTNHDLSEK